MPGLVQAAEEGRFDYFEANRELISRGVQAVLMCNGLFTSGRTLAQVFEQVLANLVDPIGTASGVGGARVSRPR